MMKRRTLAGSGLSDSEIILVLLERNWISNESKREIVRLRRQRPEGGLLDLLVEKGYITSRQAGELALPEVSKVPTRAPLPGVTIDRDEIEALSETPLPGLEANYQPIIRLGEGGMGEVMAVYDPRLRRRIALKRVLPGKRHEGTVLRFVEEAQITAQLDHPTIPPVHEMAKDDSGEFFYTMKEVRGRTLSEVIAEGGTPLTKFLRILEKVAEGIEFAHARGVLHRDLKPENLMVGDYGEVYVMDWGLAQVRTTGGKVTVETERSDSERPDLKTAGALGTPLYMAPEQARGGEEATERTDVYLLGGILYEILTGTPPHRPRKGEGRLALLRRIAEEPVEGPSRRASDRTIPRELEAIALRALQVDPGNRYETPLAFQREISAFLDGRLVGAARYSTGQVIAKWMARHKGATAAIAGAILLVASLTGWRLSAWWSHRQAVQQARSTIEAVDPAGVMGDADRLVDQVSQDPVKRTSPSPEMRVRLTRSMKDLEMLIGKERSLLALAPGDEIRSKILDGLDRYACLCVIAEEFSLAEKAILEIADLEEDGARVVRLSEDLDAARRVQCERVEARRRGVEEILAKAETGRLDSDVDYDVALGRLIGYKHPETIRAMIERLEGVTEILSKVTRQHLLSACEGITEDEASGIVKRWLSLECPESPDMPREEAAVIERALTKIRDASARPGKNRGNRWSWRMRLAIGQARALDEGGHTRERLLQLVCEAFGPIGEPEGTLVALERYLRSEWSQSRAVPAGIALARLASVDPGAERILLGLVGFQPGGGIRRSRWTLDGHWWSRVSPYLPGEVVSEVGDSSPGEYHRRGVLRLQGKDVEGALRDLEEAAKRAPGDAQIWTDLGGARLKAGYVDRAMESFDRALEIDPACVRARANRALAWIEKGNHEKAFDDLDRALAMETTNGLLWDQRGMLRYFTGQHEAALRDLDRAIECNGDQDSFWCHRGVVRKKLGDMTGARSDIDRAIELDPRSFEALCNRGRIRREQGDSEGSLEDYTRALRIRPDVATILIERGTLLRDMGHLDRGASDFERSLKNDPENQEARLHLGEILYLQGDQEGAIAEYDRILEGDPENARAWLARGLAEMARKNLDQAALDINTALNLEPENPDIWYRRGAVWYAKGKLAMALDDLDHAVTMNPGLVEAWVLKGKIFLRAKKYDEAIDSFNRALDRDDSNTLALARRGDAYAHKKEPDRALADFERILDIDPVNVDGWLGKGSVLYMKRDREGAKKAWMRALEIRPNASWAPKLRKQLESMSE